MFYLIKNKNKIMEDNVKLPRKLVFNNEKSKNFDKFIQAFEIYLEAADLTQASDSRKIALLLNVAGEEAVEVFNTFKIGNEEKKQYASVVNEFKKYCSHRESETFSRFMFFKRVKEEQETFDNFFKDLKLLAKKCKFGDQLESLIRDRIVIGVQDLELQDALLSVGELSLEKAEKMCRAAEAKKSTLNGVDLIRPKDKEYYQCYNKCDRRPKKGECLTFDKECRKCGELDHFKKSCTKTKMLKSKNTPVSISSQNYKSKKIKEEIECPLSASDGEEGSIDALSIKTELERDLEMSELAWYEKINGNGVNLSNSHENREDWWFENTQECTSSDPLSISSECDVKKSPTLRNNPSENFCTSNTSKLSNIFSENSSLFNITSGEPTENTLYNFLQSCNDGMELLQTYRQTGIIKRRKLVDLVINEELKNDLNLRICKDRFLFLSESICTIFPTECKNSYFIPAHRSSEGKPISAHGKLWDKYINQRVKYQKLKLIPKRKSGNEGAQSSETDEDKLDDALYHEMLNYLSTSTCDREEIQNYWWKTSKRRLNDYNKEQTQIHDYFKKFPALSQPYGHDLISIDFSILHPGKEDIFINTWPVIAKAIINVGKSKKCPIINRLLTKFQDGDTFIYDEKVVALFLLPLLFPSTYRGSKQNIKRYSKSEVQEAFIFYIEDENKLELEFEKRKHKLAATKTTDQPLVFVVNNGTAYPKSLLKINDNLYEVETPVTAINLCFKSFFVFRAKYPHQCELAWIYLQQFVYGIVSTGTERKTSTIASTHSDILSENQRLLGSVKSEPL